ncbi:glutamyl-tRNA amidotransferase [Chromatiales bacterium (ex Bugula neritina AB1)]|nr:glutamyl-tRNA amidotransferase [Chromatiales bacterium (ex Bugula neritina AB1)]
MSAIKAAILADIKTCMKTGDKTRLGVLRLISAAVKQREVDERIEIDDPSMITILDKMAKQRRESIEQFTKGDRADLAAVELAELEIIQTYLPQALPQDEIESLIETAISNTGASSIRDMGKVMGILKPQLQGRADMSAVSALIKSKLGA